ncbi:MAG: TetR family transcriptional regulator [Solirubrobacteraceae bacterium]
MRARAGAAAETERRIIDAALELFSERLYDQVALAGIAAAAGVSSQTVIRRFGSNEGLVAAAASSSRHATSTSGRRCAETSDSAAARPSTRSAA